VRPEARALFLAGGLLVLAVAVVLGSVLTPAPHTGGDNAAYLALGYALSQGLGYVELWDPLVLPHTEYPPAFPLLLAGLMAVGVSSWVTFKMAMAVLVSAALILVFGWAGGRRGALAGLGVALLTLLSGGWIDASRWILSEPLFLALTFLSLWAGDRGGLRWEAEEGGDRSSAWLLVAGAAALLALLTRSAGLPLVLALAAMFLLARRRTALVIFGATTLVVGGAWGLRALRGGEGAYQSEFWMVNPYEPALGTIGFLDLPWRLWENLGIYLGSVLPAEWWPASGLSLVVLGLLLAALALAGWGRRLLRREVGTAELFLPLYAGLILLWPPVWSGDRFALPLYPILLLYAGEALVAGLARITGARGEGSPGRQVAKGSPGRLVPLGVVAAGFLALALPAVPSWLETAGEAGACRARAEADVFRCHAPAVAEFRDAAGWTGRGLPEEAVVLNRKPRIFYVLGGSRGRIFPFSRDPADLLREADRLGARYLLVGFPDGVTLSYLPAVVEGSPGAFCVVEGWGEATTLLGILPPGSREGTQVTRCPPEYGPEASRAPAEPAEDARRVPLLVSRPGRR
jgi:hypothetical protein